jgi:hypothetical protein
MKLLHEFVPVPLYPPEPTVIVYVVPTVTATVFLIEYAPPPPPPPA